MPDQDKWYDNPVQNAEKMLRAFFDLAAGKGLPGGENAPTRNPLGGGGLAPKPQKTGFDWGRIFSSGSGPSEAERLFQRDLMKKQGLRQSAAARGNSREISEIDADMKRMREEGAQSYAARRMRERAEVSK